MWGCEPPQFFKRGVQEWKRSVVHVVRRGSLQLIIQNNIVRGSSPSFHPGASLVMRFIKDSVETNKSKRTLKPRNYPKVSLWVRPTKINKLHYYKNCLDLVLTIV